MCKLIENETHSFSLTREIWGFRNVWIGAISNVPDYAAGEATGISRLSAGV